MLYCRTQIQKCGSEQLIGRLLDEHFITWVDQCSHHQMIGYVGASGNHHAVLINPAFLRNGVLQRGIAISAVAGDLQLLNGDRKLAQGKRAHTAGSEIEPRMALRLRPKHVVRMTLSHSSGWGGIGRASRLQYKYTGMPASRIIRPIAEFAGKVAIVLVTMAAQANTKTAVV